MSEKLAKFALVRQLHTSPVNRQVMKQILLILSMLLMVVGASAQPRGGNDPYDPGRGGRNERYEPGRNDRNGRGGRDSRYGRDGRSGRGALKGRPYVAPAPGPGVPGGPAIPPAEVRCTHEWQELWNGCHVRLSNGRVSVLDANGNRVVGGEDVILLGDGNYMVRNGDLWRIYDWRGDYTTISGHDIRLWPNGLYCVRFSSSWRVYDRQGDRLTNVWGDHVELMNNGLIRCTRAGRDHYYDERGKERR